MAKKNTQISGPTAMYVGPEYHTGIYLPGRSTPIDPKAMDDQARAEFISNHPQYADWWRPAPVTDPIPMEVPPSDDVNTPE